MLTARSRPLTLENIDPLIRFCIANDIDFNSLFVPKILPGTLGSYYRSTLLMTLEEQIVGIGVMARSESMRASELVSNYSPAGFEYRSEITALTTALLTTTNLFHHSSADTVVTAVQDGDDPLYDIFMDIGAVETSGGVVRITGPENNEKVLRFEEKSITGHHARLVCNALDLPSGLGIQLIDFPDGYEIFVRVLKDDGK